MDRNLTVQLPALDDFRLPAYLQAGRQQLRGTREWDSRANAFSAVACLYTLCKHQCMRTTELHTCGDVAGRTALLVWEAPAWSVLRRHHDTLLGWMGLSICCQRHPYD